MHFTLSTLLLVSQTLAASAAIINVTYPNAYPKQLAAVRRRAGLTTAEYLYHHTIVHGRKAWNAPDSIDQPLAYFQAHVFDSAYGINTTANLPEPNYFGHNDMTELYSRSEAAFATPPPNNYTATVIGPDGNAFSDFSSAISMYAYETFPKLNSTCCHPPAAGETVFNAFYWVFAAAPNANTSSFSNTTFASPIMSTLLSSFAPGTIYNASIHTPVPGLDSRPYYGGYGNPTLNAVFKFWLCDDNEAVGAFRAAQKGLLGRNWELGIGLGESFVMFTREVLVYDRSVGEGFSTVRGIKVVEKDRWRGDVVVSGPEE